MLVNRSIFMQYNCSNEQRDVIHVVPLLHREKLPAATATSSLPLASVKSSRRCHRWTRMSGIDLGLCGLSGIDLGQFGLIWADLGRFGLIWVDLGRFGSIWVDLDWSGASLGLIGLGWVDLSRFEPIWADLG